MKPRRALLLLVSALAAACAGAAVPDATPARPNILLLCVDDLRPELRSFGASHIHSPAIDSLAASGRAFTRHYVQAPTCGASRSALLTGQYAPSSELRDNDALFRRAALPDGPAPTLPRHFREHGYRTVAIGKISHHPGGLGGEEWNDPAKIEMPDAWDLNLMPSGPWRTPRRAMHGYAGGAARVPKKTPAFEHTDEEDPLAYPDGWITRESLAQLDALAAQPAPFFLAVGIIKPHLPFVTPRSYLDRYADAELPPIPHPKRPPGLTTWHESGEFFGAYAHDGRDPRADAAYADQIRRSYAASVTYADDQVAQILARLEALKLAANTIVILWGDHGFHLGEHAIWGKHALFEESLRAPLVIRAPGLKIAPGPTAAVVESVDIYPTLCDLAGLETPAGLSGASLRPHLLDATQMGDAAISYTPRAETIRTPRHRLIRHAARGDSSHPAYELYDHATPAGETLNLAATYPELVAELDALLRGRLGS